MSVIKATNQSYTMLKEKEQYPKSTLCMLFFSAGTVCRTSPNSRKCKNCTEPQAMSPGDV